MNSAALNELFYHCFIYLCLDFEKDPVYIDKTSEKQQILTYKRPVKTVKFCEKTKIINQ